MVLEGNENAGYRLLRYGYVTEKYQVALVNIVLYQSQLCP